MAKIFIYLLLLVSSIVAQPSSRLTLAACLNIAFKNHPEIQSRVWQIKSLGAVYQQEKSVYYPKFLLDGHYHQFFYRDYNYREQGLLLMSDWSLGSWLQNSAESAALAIEASKANLSKSRLSLARRITGIYFRILKSDLWQQSFEYRKTLLEQHAQIAKAFWETGVRSRLDLLRTRAATLALEQEQRNIVAQGSALREELATLLNGQDSKPVDVQPFSSRTTAPDSIIGLQDICQILLENHPGIQALTFQIQATQLQRRKITAALLPHLQMWGGYVADGDPTSDGDYGLVGIGMSVPLFQWGQSEFQKEEVAATIRDLEYQRSNLRNELKIEAEKLFEEMSKLTDIIHIQREQLDITQQAFELAKVQYEAGLITNLEYLDAQQTWQETHLQLQDTQLRFLLQKIEIYLLTGNYQLIAQIQGA